MDEIGLIASITPEVSDRDARDARRKLERDVSGQPIELDVEIPKDKLREAQAPTTKERASSMARTAGSKAKSAGRTGAGMAAQGGQFLGKVAATKMARRLGIPMTMPSWDLPGGFGGGMGDAGPGSGPIMPDGGAAGGSDADGIGPGSEELIDLAVERNEVLHTIEEALDEDELSVSSAGGGGDGDGGLLPDWLLPFGAGAASSGGGSGGLLGSIWNKIKGGGSKIGPRGMGGFTALPHFLNAGRSAAEGDMGGAKWDIGKGLFSASGAASGAAAGSMFGPLGTIGGGIAGGIGADALFEPLFGGEYDKEQLDQNVRENEMVDMLPGNTGYGEDAEVERPDWLDDFNEIERPEWLDSFVQPDWMNTEQSDRVGYTPQPEDRGEGPVTGPGGGVNLGTGGVQDEGASSDTTGMNVQPEDVGYGEPTGPGNGVQMLDYGEQPEKQQNRATQWAQAMLQADIQMNNTIEVDSRKITQDINRMIQDLQSDIEENLRREIQRDARGGAR